MAYTPPVAESPTLAEPSANGPDAARRPWADRLALALGLAATGWTLASWGPLTLPAWPAGSLGVLALAFAWPRGRALPRAIGAFLGLLGILGAAAQIAAIWGVAALLER